MEHLCQYCGKSFEAKKGAKYCKTSCRSKASRKRTFNETTTVIRQMVMDCAWCGVGKMYYPIGVKPNLIRCNSCYKTFKLIEE